MNREFRYLVYTREGGVGTLLLRAPPLNIITRALLEELNAAFQTLEHDPELRAVVLGSALPEAFCAGADIKQFRAWTSATGSENCRFGARVYHRIARFPHPVLCAVNAGAFGGGLELAMACDIRIFEEHITVSLPECALGMQPGYGGTQRLPRLAGPGFAKLIMYTSLPVTAQRAFQAGLADALAPRGGGLAAAQEMARTIARRAPMAVARVKQSVAYAMEHGIEDGLEFENRGITLLCATDDKREGADAFLAKREPEFHNR